jgi:hypothetical protein
MQQTVWAYLLDERIGGAGAQEVSDMPYGIRPVAPPS